MQRCRAEAIWSSVSTGSSAGASGNEAGGRDSSSGPSLLSLVHPPPPPSPPGVIALFCRQYDIIKDNEPNNSKEKTKSASETSTPEHQGGGLLRSKVRAGLGPRWAAPGLQQGQLGAGSGRGWAEPSLPTVADTGDTARGFRTFSFCREPGASGVNKIQ